MDGSMDALRHFETVEYPRIWHLANDAGKEARKQGLPRVCNLKDSPFCHNGNILKVYKSAWEQGYDDWEIPAVFKQMEAAVNQMPLRPMEEKDL